MIEISDLKGKMVITKDAFNVGEISEFTINDNWRVTHILIKLTKEATEELGFKKPMLGHVTICLPSYYVKDFGDVITLSRNRDELKEIPECKIE